MKVIEFKADGFIYGYAGQTEQEIRDFIIEEYGDEEFDDVVEIPESEWDKETIAIWEDNNFDEEPYYISIREAIVGNEPQMIYSNDLFK
jgi:hypothetical protein